MSLIGRRWKCREAWSWPILISRGLDLQKLWRNTQALVSDEEFVSLFGFQGAEQRISKINSEPSEGGLNWRGSTTKWVSFRRRWKRRMWSLCWRDAPLAQLVEQLTLNQWVPGSSPWRCTKLIWLVCRMRYTSWRELKKERGHGPLVKWLRQRPLTPLTSVRIRYGSPNSSWQWAMKSL